MKNKFIKSTIILIIGGFITKILGMIIKIVMTRQIGTEGIGLYMLIMPTFMILISISTLGLPVAISKLVAEDTKNNRKLIFSSIPITIVLNIIIFLILFLTAKYISVNLLHDERTYYGILSIGFVLPFISISSILRGYFFGKEKMIPHVITNIIEDIIKLVLIIIGIPLFLTKGIEYAISFIILSNIFCELSTIIIFLLWSPSKLRINKDDIIPNKKYINEILSIGLPTTGSRIIGSIGYFLEPIILTFVLTNLNYNNNYIISEYGVISGYILPLVLLPSFFTNAISSSLLPIISKSYAKGDINYTKNKIKQSIIISLLIGLPATIILLLFPEFLLKLIYNTKEGIPYLKALAPICLLYYIQSPLTTAMQALNMSKKAMMGTTIGMIIRTILLFACSYLNIGLWGLIIAISSNIIYVTFDHLYNVKKRLL